MATETRQQILSEAREVFLKEGLAGFSMRTVAERVGISATALYRHFDDKDALLASLLGEAFGTFGSYLGRALAGKSPLERLHLAGLAYVDFALDQRLETFLAMHQRALEYFGGVPRRILYDNLKSVVLHHIGSTVQFNPRFLFFAGHHLFEPNAFTEALGPWMPEFHAPPGNGLGFDDLLGKLPWKRLS